MIDLPVRLQPRKLIQFLWERGGWERKLESDWLHSASAGSMGWTHRPCFRSSASSG
jgi:hypothetical protein